MAEIRIGYFLEDIAQERFICALVTRVAEEMGIPRDKLHHEVRNASGGAGQAMTSLDTFLERWMRDREPSFDLLIVAIDGNCQRYTTRRREIAELLRRKGYTGLFACAVPNPHIERWYLADPVGVRRALSSPREPHIPRYKCERDRYKQALSQALRDADLEAPLGGAEYGDEIAWAMDLHRAGRNDRALKHFLDDLRQGLAEVARSRGVP